MIPFAKTGDAGTTMSHAVIPAGGRDRTRVQYERDLGQSGFAADISGFGGNIGRPCSQRRQPKVIGAAPFAGAAQNDVVTLLSKASGQAVRGVVDAVDAVAKTITLKANLGIALAPGGTVHLMAAKGQIPVGAATKEANTPTVFAALEGPVLVELDGTAACRINLVAGEYF